MSQKTRKAGETAGEVETEEQIEATGDAILVHHGLVAIADAIAGLADAIRENTRVMGGEYEGEPPQEDAYL